VDDEPVARDIIISYCDNLPHIHVVAVCGSALEAKTFLQDNRVDIMFLDIHLPVLDGISLLNVLRNLQRMLLICRLAITWLSHFHLTDLLLLWIRRLKT
jgi:CheY-like chemotaxis protein